MLIRSDGSSVTWISFADRCSSLMKYIVWFTPRIFSHIHRTTPPPPQPIRTPTHLVRNHGREVIRHLQPGTSLQTFRRPRSTAHDDDQVHKLCQQSAERILNDFQPNLMIAIGGGGYVPARILRYSPSSSANGTSCPLTKSFINRLQRRPDRFSNDLIRPTSPSKLSDYLSTRT